MCYIKNMKRNYFNIYFPYMKKNGERISKNVCIAFGDREKVLYEKTKLFSSTDIKKLINIFSYNQLLKTADTEDRTPTQLIKLRLKENILKKKTKYVKDKRKIEKWIKLLKEDEELSKKLVELIDYLKTLK